MDRNTIMGAVLILSTLFLNGCLNNSNTKNIQEDSGRTVDVAQITQLSASENIYTSASINDGSTILFGGDNGLTFTSISNRDPMISKSSKHLFFDIPTFSSNATDIKQSSALNTDANKSKVKIYSICNVANSLYIGGKFAFVNGVKKDNIIRLTSSGAIDDDFNASVEGSVYKIIKTDTNIFIAGAFGSYNEKYVHSIAKLDLIGTLDESFNPFADYMIARINDIAVLPNDKIVLAGTFVKEACIEDQNSSMEELIQKTRAVIILNVNGTIDESLSEKFADIKHEAYAIDVLNDTIYIGGGFEFIKEKISFNDLVAYTIEGDLNTDFHIGKLSGLVFDVKVQDDKIIFAGDFILDDDLKTRSFYMVDLFGNTVNINNFSVDADIYSIEMYEGSLVLSGAGNFKLSGSQYSNSISLKLED